MTAKKWEDEIEVYQTAWGRLDEMRTILSRDADKRSDPSDEVLLFILSGAVSTAWGLYMYSLRREREAKKKAEESPNVDTDDEDTHEKLDSISNKIDRIASRVHNLEVWKAWNSGGIRSRCVAREGDKKEDNEGKVDKK